MWSRRFPFTVFDVETTGLNPKGGDRIVEIAGVHLNEGLIEEKETFSSLVNPECAVPWEAQRLHLLTEEELTKAPTIMDVLPHFLEFARGSILIAHNAEFDLSFLEVEKEVCWGYAEIPDCLCTMLLSRSLFPNEYRHNLDVVATRLGIISPPNRHRALPDALITAQVFLKLIEEGNIQSLDELRELAQPKVVA